MEPNMHITLKVSRFSPDTPHDSVVALFRQIQSAANEIAAGAGLEVRASWDPVPDPLELDEEPAAETPAEELGRLRRELSELGHETPEHAIVLDRIAVLTRAFAERRSSSGSSDRYYVCSACGHYWSSPVRPDDRRCESCSRAGVTSRARDLFEAEELSERALERSRA